MLNMNALLAATALAIFASPVMAQDAAEAGADAGAEVTTEATTEAATDAAQDAAGATAEAAGAVVAATPADVKAGVDVRDTQGGMVGTIESVDANGAVISTGESRVQIPVTSFAKNDAGLVIAMSKAELEAAAKAANPA